MCLAVPMKLVERKDELGVVELGGVRREVHLGFVPDLAIGDYVLVHAGFVIERLQPEQAEEDLRLLSRLLEESEGGTTP